METAARGMRGVHVRHHAGPSQVGNGGRRLGVDLTTPCMRPRPCPGIAHGILFIGDVAVHGDVKKVNGIHAFDVFLLLHFGLRSEAGEVKIWHSS